jgi:hypothetical protein
MATADTRAAELLLEAQTAAQAHSPGDRDMDHAARLAFQVGWLEHQVRKLCMELEHAGAFDTVEHRDEPDREAEREADEWRREARNFARETGAARELGGRL